MLFTTMLIDALHATLENAEIALNRVAMNRWQFIIDMLTGLGILASRRSELPRWVSQE